MSKRILVIEDDEMIRSLLSEVLSSEGYDVSLAEDGRSGIRLFKQDPHDLVITDIVMPGQTGIEVVTEIKRKRAETKVIVITGVDKSERDKLLQISTVMGADNTLQKPLSKESLISMVEKTLQQ